MPCFQRGLGSASQPSVQHQIKTTEHLIFNSYPPRRRGALRMTFHKLFPFPVAPRELSRLEGEGTRYHFYSHSTCSVSPHLHPANTQNTPSSVTCTALSSASPANKGGQSWSRWALGWGCYIRGLNHPHPKFRWAAPMSLSLSGKRNPSDTLRPAPAQRGHSCHPAVLTVLNPIDFINQPFICQLRS